MPLLAGLAALAIFHGLVRDLMERREAVAATIPELPMQRRARYAADYGLSEIGTLSDVLNGRCEAAMRAAIAEVPDGDYSYRMETDGLSADQPLVFAVTVNIDGDVLRASEAGHDDLECVRFCSDVQILPRVRDDTVVPPIDLDREAQQQDCTH